MSKTTTDQLVLAVQAQFYVKQLIKDGYSQEKIANQAKLSQANISRILFKPEYGKVKLSNQLKLAEVWENHNMKQINDLENKNSYFLTSEDIIDSEAAEEEAKELEKFLVITFAILGVLLVGFIFLIKYIIGLF
jgi:predicted transcriptional regulator